VAVDDVGAGFASLRHLLDLNPELIKLDISLCRLLDADRRRFVLASALVGFAGEIGATVVAEGVETADEMHALIDLGIDLGQGYWLGRPGELPEVLTPVAALNGNGP
jgi:EAL domain-containing protein (putative c-di-GMP-specific phosphodiesterase class I)